MTRIIAQKLVEVFPHICRGDVPLAGSDAATRRITNARLQHLGRRSDACKIPPGYVGSLLPVLTLSAYFIDSGRRPDASLSVLGSPSQSLFRFRATLCLCSVRLRMALVASLQVL